MKQLVIFKTHVLSWWILEEYFKLVNTKGIDCVILYDNTNNTFKDNGEPISKHSLDGYEFDCILMTKNKIKSLYLPLHSHTTFPKFSNAIWYNADYPVYLVKSILPDYDYYWHLEYDIYCKEQDYSKFFEKYSENDSDFIVPLVRVAEKEWEHQDFSEWIYPASMTRYASFFPIARWSSNFVDFAMNKRIEHGQKYLAAANKKPDVRWLFCEYFAIMEAIYNGFKVTSIDDEKLRFDNEYSMGEIYGSPGSAILYHPVKTR